MTPEWLLTAVWFIAGVFGTGAFWFFLSTHRTDGLILSGLGAIASAFIAITLHVRNDRLCRNGVVPVPVRLLSFVWSYPLAGENQASWAVKESAVLEGNLGSARDEPGLGVAIITTELALAAFGRAARGRIDRCVRWGLEHTEHDPPYQITAGVRDQSTWAMIDVKPDLRHTFAFGVILARTHHNPEYLEVYVRLAVARQCEEDGGWPATISPVFTALYAVELLHLVVSAHQFGLDLTKAAHKARDRGIGWLMRNRDGTGLWSSGALTTPWDRALASGWVLHRLARTASVPVAGWRECLETAFLAMIEKARSSDTWIGCGESQRQRVEARIAAAVSRTRRFRGLPPVVRNAAASYLAEWRDRALRWAKTVLTEEIDVATAAFVVEALATGDQLRNWGQLVLASDITSSL